jgi:hypothetical protein
MYGKIYRLDQGDLTFLGSTINPRLRQRLGNHRLDFNRWLKTGLGYNSSFELFKNGSPTITLIESVCCASRAELRARQGYHQSQIKNININRAGGNPNAAAEWRLAHLEQRKTYIKDWNESNADKIKKYNAIYYERNSIKLKFKNNRNYYNTKRLLLLNEFIMNHLKRQLI